MIVLLSGKQGSGKSTIQKVLKQRWEQETKGRAFDINFADVIYEMHNAVLDILHKYIPPRPIAKDGKLLQLLGTEWGRDSISRNLWVDIMKSKIKSLIGPDPSPVPKIVIIGDCRFENEFEAFPGALRVRLTASEEARRKRCSAWRTDTLHPSELGLDFLEKLNAFDIVIDTEKNRVETCVNMIYTALKGRLSERDQALGTPTPSH